MSLENLYEWDLIVTIAAKIVAIFAMLIWIKMKRRNKNVS